MCTWSHHMVTRTGPTTGFADFTGLCTDLNGLARVRSGANTDYPDPIEVPWAGYYPISLLHICNEKIVWIAINITHSAIQVDITPLFNVLQRYEVINMYNSWKNLLYFTQTHAMGSTLYVHVSVDSVPYTVYTFTVVYICVCLGNECCWGSLWIWKDVSPPGMYIY